MPRDLPFVFVSSTFKMAAERQQVKEALDPPLDVGLYEEEPAPGTSAEAECRRMIEMADFWIGVHGADWGTAHDSARGISIVEWEFELARRRAANGLPIFAYLSVDPNDPAAPIHDGQRAFLRRLTGFRSVSYQRFRDGPELADKVRRSVMGWLARVRHEAAQVESARGTGARGYLLFGGLFLACAGAAILGLALGQITTKAALSVVAVATLGFAGASYFAGHARALRSREA